MESKDCMSLDEKKNMSIIIKFRKTINTIAHKIRHSKELTETDKLAIKCIEAYEKLSAGDISFSELIGKINKDECKGEDEGQIIKKEDIDDDHEKLNLKDVERNIKMNITKLEILRKNRKYKIIEIGSNVESKNKKCKRNEDESSLQIKVKNETESKIEKEKNNINNEEIKGKCKKVPVTDMIKVMNPMTLPIIEKPKLCNDTRMSAILGLG